MLEVERKYTLPAGVTAAEAAEELDLGPGRHDLLRATYLDTPELDLAGAGATLRRRLGGPDEGWHLKLPVHGDARLELQCPLDAAPGELQVPASLRERADVGPRPLVPVAELHTERTRTPILYDGTPVATLCDDLVTARCAGRVEAWREVEVELVGEPADADRLLDDLGACLESHGATPARPVPKLVRALGPVMDRGTVLPGDPHSAARVVASYLADQLGVIQSRLAQAEDGDPDAVHKVRVATRRLRSTLRTFRPLLDAGLTEPLRPRIRDLSAALGGPRDAQVLEERLIGLIGDLPSTAIHGPVEQRVRAELDAQRTTALAGLGQVLTEPTTLDLLDDLSRLVAAPPLRPEADRPAREVLPRLLRHSARRTLRAWGRAQDADEGRLELVHESRKKAKATRYGWEAAVDTLPRGEETARAWEAITEALGTAQDTVVARSRLQDLAAAAVAHGEPTFTYGVLWQQEMDRQEEALADAAAALGAVRSPRVGRR
ncbi:CYTH and CHAD domain-containing protein [Acidipropionibacterium timonense]|uniref:CYTH and CHAD domain-containing protein n=1 Tax=Acidipropionibacterium timonense TaxID=2161818 RepID=UPI0014369979|nr:CYTH and CHAD domain-containing protein [Acidipropionibacterium timonense]